MKPSIIISILGLLFLAACQHVRPRINEDPTLYKTQHDMFWADGYLGQQVRVQGVMMAPEQKGYGGFGVLFASGCVMYVRGSYQDFEGYLVEAEGKLAEVRIPRAGMGQGIPGGALMYWLESPSVKKIQRLEDGFQQLTQCQ